MHIRGVFVTLFPNALMVFVSSLVDPSLTHCVNPMDVHCKRTNLRSGLQGSL